VAEHHDKEAQPPAGVADPDRAVLAPVHLGTFARGERQSQEGRRPPRANVADVVLDDGDPAGVADLAQPQKNLRRGVRMSRQPADDPALERIELARPTNGPPAAELVHRQPLGHRPFVQTQLAGDLPSRQAAGVMAILDLAVQCVVDHVARSVISRRTWPMLIGSATGARGSARADAPRASTWYKGL